MVHSQQATRSNGKASLIWNPPTAATFEKSEGSVVLCFRLFATLLPEVSEAAQRRGRASAYFLQEDSEVSDEREEKTNVYFLLPCQCVHIDDAP